MNPLTTIQTYVAGAVAALCVLIGVALGWYAPWVGANAQIAAANKRLADYRSGEAAIALRQAQRVVAVVGKQDEITANVGAKAETAIQSVRTVTRTIKENVYVYVPAKADAGCTVNVGFQRLFNAAVSGSPVGAVPDPAARADDAPSGVALSTVADVTNENAGICRENAAKLSGLQEWIPRQTAVSK